MDPSEFLPSPKSLPRRYSLPLIPSLGALEETEPSFQTRKALALPKSRTRFKDLRRSQKPPAPMGRDRAARKHDVETGSQPLCYSQPCLLTPPTDPSGSESYSEQNLLRPARASRKREPLAAAGTRARSLNYEDAEDSACPALGGGAPLALSLIHI